MIIQVLILVAGLALIVFGADWLVDGASSIARKLGISEFVIGLTIVGFGTSCPELVVSLTGALKGLADISIGNVVGSNILNVLLILGLTAVIAPIAITEENRRRDIPITLGVTMLLIMFGLYRNDISRIEGIIFLSLFAGYMYYCFKTDSADVEEAEDKGIGAGMAVLLIIAGLAGLVFGGRFFVNSATSIAKMIGVSDKFIAITVLAGGTSLPELATCVVAAIKKRGQLALGNILGSNLFNILLILGTSAVVTPLSFAGMSYVDLGIVLTSMLLVFASAYTFDRSKIDRVDGAIMLLCEIGYFTWLVVTI